MMQETKHRCEWAHRSPEEILYHDTEWGVPVHDESRHFEFLVLESSQAGLSWLTILRKRAGYRNSFASFDPATVATYTPEDVERLLQDASIIRNRKKIEAAINNARAFLRVQEEYGSFDAYIWDFTGGAPIQNAWRSLQEIPPQTPLSVALAKDLKRRGFAFLGPTTVYAHMQAIGVVNDHVVSCFRYEEIKRLG